MLIKKPFKKGMGPSIAPFYKAAAALTASYVNKGSGADNGSGATTLTFTCDIGTATATRVILIGSMCQSTTDFTGVTANGVSLASIPGTTSNAGHAVGFWSIVGASPGSGVQTIILNGGQFFQRGAEVWILDGLNSTSAKNVGVSTGGGPTITTAVGDFLFANNFCSATESYTTSTEVPANTYDNHTNGGQAAADWTIVSTNGTFSIVLSPSPGADGCAVTFR